MRLGYAIIYVPSVPSTLEFYSAAFGLATRFCVPSNDYGEVEVAGSTTLAFAEESSIREGLGGGDPFRLNRKENAQAAGAEIGFVVDGPSGETVQAVYDRAVKAGATPVKQPAKKPWGQEVAYVKDLNGFLVEICTPVQP